MFLLLPSLRLCALSLAFYLPQAYSQSVPVTGTHTGIDPVTGARPLRRNILDLQNDVPSWSLFIQGLARMQALSEDDLTSFYQIAGIHGRPFVAYDKVGEDPYLGAPNWRAYCQHSSLLFPSWHRPYLAMIEQIILRLARQIALEYTGPEADVYVAAADNLRLTYWDWGSNSTMPDIINEPNISITTPDGVAIVPNPLYSYAMPNLGTAAFPPGESDSSYLNYPTTVRDPGNDGKSRPANVNAVMNKGNFKNLVYNLFTRATTYSQFATSINPGISIEAVHGNVHVNVGGAKGHMTALTYSSFDPIFWLHHNNCDRLWAIYQALYPDLWISASGLANEIGTFTIPRGAIEYANTSLTPFYTSNSTPAVFWTSDTARTTKVFGYSYPELDDWSQTPDQLKQNVTAQVNALYGPTAVAATTTPRAHIPGTAHRHPHTRQVVQAPITEWFITCSVDKLSLKGSSFTVLFFLDAAPADSSIWSSATNLLGSMSVLVPPGMASTGHTSPTLQYTELPITDILVELGLDSADEAAVGPALAERLQWKVQLLDKTAVATTSLASLNIKVTSEIVTPTIEEDRFPIYAAPEEANVQFEVIGGVVKGVLADLVKGLGVDISSD